jgi:hypothetical protein
LTLAKAILLLKFMFSMKVKGKLIFNFDGGGNVSQQFTIEGGSELLENREDNSSINNGYSIKRSRDFTAVDKTHTAAGRVPVFLFSLK